MRAGEIIASIVIGSLEVVAVGILLCVGFHIGGKVIEKVESKAALAAKKRLAKGAAIA